MQTSFAFTANIKLDRVVIVSALKKCQKPEKIPNRGRRLFPAALVAHMPSLKGQGRASVCDHFQRITDS